METICSKRCPWDWASDGLLRTSKSEAYVDVNDRAADRLHCTVSYSHSDKEEM